MYRNVSFENEGEHPGDEVAEESRTAATAHLSPAGATRGGRDARHATRSSPAQEQNESRQASSRCCRTAVPHDRERPGLGVGLGAYAQANAHYSPAVGQRGHAQTHT